MSSRFQTTPSSFLTNHLLPDWFGGTRQSLDPPLVCVNATRLNGWRNVGTEGAWLFLFQASVTFFSFSGDEGGRGLWTNAPGLPVAVGASESRRSGRRVRVQFGTHALRRDARGTQLELDVPARGARESGMYHTGNIWVWPPNESFKDTRSNVTVGNAFGLL